MNPLNIPGYLALRVDRAYSLLVVSSWGTAGESFGVKRNPWFVFTGS